MHYPKSFQALITHFASLPSVGPKMAERLVLFLFKEDNEKLVAFAEALENLKQLSACERCFYISEATLCEFCANVDRDHGTLCVVEEPLDVIAIERTGNYRGVYHVLGGTLDTAREESSLHVAELVQRARKSDVTEIILATNPTTEGDLTALFLKSKLKGLPVKVTRIARGLATGGDIEYADETTLTASLTNRKELV